MDEFLSALQSGSWSVILGAVLTALAPAVGYILDGKLSPLATRWASLVRGVVFGLGVSLMGGGVWWLALASGLFGLLNSQGFRDQVRAVLPDYQPPGGAV